MIHKARVFLLIALCSGLLSACSDQSTNPSSALRIRKNVKNLTSQERKDLVDAMLAMKQAPSPYEAHLSYYDQFVSWHRGAFDCNLDAAHMGPAFFPWHRQYLLLFEKGLKDVSGKEIMLPYWDWPDPAATAAVFNDSLMGGDGDPANGYAVMNGPFNRSTWVLNITDPLALDPAQLKYLVRRFGSFPGAGALPTTADVEEALSRPSYDVAPWDPGSDPSLSFRNNLEGWRHCHDTICVDGWMDPICDSGQQDPELHNLVHLYIGGMINDSTTGTITLNTSPNDPAFFLLHSNVDRMWYLWRQRHGSVNAYEPATGAPEGMNLRDKMWPYYVHNMIVTPEDMIDAEKLGYTYE